MDGKAGFENPIVDRLNNVLKIITVRKNNQKSHLIFQDIQ